MMIIYFLNQVYPAPSNSDPKLRDFIYLFYFYFYFIFYFFFSIINKFVYIFARPFHLVSPKSE